MTIRQITAYWAPRDKQFENPITREGAKEMKHDRRKPEERMRERVLRDGEIRAVWEACDELGGSFAGIVKLALLTAQRREKIASMKWSDVDLETGVWTIDTEAGEKGNAGVLKLPRAAVDIIADQPKLAENPFVFFGTPRGRHRRRDTTREPTHFGAWSDKRPNSTRSYLRTCRHGPSTTCAGRAASDGSVRYPRLLAERTLGHELQGMMRVYNRYSSKRRRPTPSPAWPRRSKRLSARRRRTGRLIRLPAKLRTHPS